MTRWSSSFPLELDGVERDDLRVSKHMDPYVFWQFVRKKNPQYFRCFFIKVEVGKDYLRIHFLVRSLCSLSLRKIA